MDANNYVIVDSSIFPHPAEKHRGAFKVFGIIQLISGLVVIGFAGYGLASALSMEYQPQETIEYLPEYREGNEDYMPMDSMYKPYPQEETRYWMLCIGFFTGIMFLISGILGLVSGCKPTNCNVIGGLVMTVLSAIAAIDLVIYQVVSVVWMPVYGRESLDAVQYSAMAFGILTFIVAIVHSAFSCATTCCAKPVKKVVPVSNTPPDYDYDYSMEKKLIEA